MANAAGWPSPRPSPGVPGEGDEASVASNRIHYANTTGNPLATRVDLQNAFRALEASLLAVWKPDAAGPDVGMHRGWYGLQPMRLETVARYLWGLVPFTAGGGTSRGWPHVLDAIAHGTDPDHPDYWGAAGGSDQRSVEMAAFGVALRLVPQQIWAPLSREQKDRFASWLAGMTDKDLVGSNWQFFRLLVTMGLRHVDRAPRNVDALEAEAIGKIDSYFLGDGWYADGRGGQRDYYIPMAFHFYGLLLAQFAEAGPVRERVGEWKARAKRFAHDFVYWFAGNGAAIPFGRSLTYRFAQGAFWSGCAIAEVDAFTPGELKGLALRHVRWWWQQPMLKPDGLLSLGYAYPNHNMLEPYNASGSPYWAFKGFAPLMLPASHAFWSQPEQPLPERPSRSVQPHPCFRIDRDMKSGHTVALSAGQWHPGWPLRHRDAKYAKLVYSTYFGLCVGPNHEWLDGVGIDGTIAVQGEGGYWLARGATTNQAVRDDHVVSDWSPFKGTTIRSWLVPLDGAWHVRVHRVQTDRDLPLAEGGFAINDPRGDGKLATDADGARSGIVELSEAGRQRELGRTEPNSSLYHSWVKVPMLRGTAKRGTSWLATAVFGAAPGSAADPAKSPTVELGGEAGFSVVFGDRRVQIAATEAEA